MEELFIPTFLINSHHLSFFNTFCFRYLYSLYSLSHEASYKEIENHIECPHLSIKPVKKDYNNENSRTY